MTWPSARRIRALTADARPDVETTTHPRRFTGSSGNRPLAGPDASPSGRTAPEGSRKGKERQQNRRRGALPNGRRAAAGAVSAQGAYDGRDRCIEWCHDRYEAGRFADQKYLDKWPKLFRGVAVLDHKGANLAPWNLANYRIRATGGRVWVDQQPLVFFHFHRFKRVSNWVYDTNLHEYGVDPSGTVRGKIYGPYIRALHEATRYVSRFLDQTGDPVAASQPLRDAHLLGRPMQWWRKRFRNRVRAGRYVIALNGHIL